MEYTSQAKFVTNPEEIAIIKSIATRAVERFSKYKFEIDHLTIQMDLSATHISCPLRLEDLLAADDFHFIHDIVGIHNNLIRWSGTLKNSFVPRFAQSDC